MLGKCLFHILSRARTHMLYFQSAVFDLLREPNYLNCDFICLRANLFPVRSLECFKMDEGLSLQRYLVWTYAWRWIVDFVFECWEHDCNTHNA